MKTLWTLFALVSAGISLVHAAETNVLSYYAVENSLDGQLLIERTNVLHFYPVYAMREYADTVEVTIYYGSKRYSRFADKMDNGDYWEVRLPQFTLGESIQRMEVEVKFALDSLICRRYANFYKYAFTDLRQRQNDRDTVDALMKDIAADSVTNPDTTKKRLTQLCNPLDDAVVKIRLDSLLTRKRAEKDISLDQASERQKRELLAPPRKAVKNHQNPKDRHEYVRLDCLTRQFWPQYDRLPEWPDSVDRALDPLFDRLVQQYQWITAIDTFLEELRHELDLKIDSLSDSLQVTSDSLRARLANTLQTGLIDTNYAGPSVRKCDIVIEPSFARARILYRNYKTSLRKMPALDPVERMGIFRVRYIPFPIIGDVSSGKMRLHSTLVGDSAALVFEVGLGFGDIYIASDDLVPKELSIRRFGVAFAVTPRLFSKDADVLAVVLTYDFNSYGSLGFGANLAHETVRPYASFGINKRAFEAAVTGLVKLFSQ